MLVPSMGSTLDRNHDRILSWLLWGVDTPTGNLASQSRDSILTLRRVERQHHLIERLHSCRDRLTFGQLAAETGVAERTIARDIERLRNSGVPISVIPGRRGGAYLDHSVQIEPVELDLPEIAALMARLAAVGPTVNASATSAMHKLAAALCAG